MRRGRKPTPTQLKVIRGNPGRRPLNADEPQPRVLLPDPPPSVKGEALAEWKRRAPQLERQGLMTELDVPAFIAYCQAWGRYVDAEEKAANREVVKTKTGYPIQNPYRAVANRALADCKAFWSDFGMTPSARSRVQVSKAAGAKPASRVDRFMQRVK